MDKKKLAGYIILAAAWFVIGWLVRDYTRDPEIVFIQKAKQIIAQHFNGPLPSSTEITHNAVRGMLYNLEDQFATFYNPELAQKLIHYRSGDYSFFGIGSERIPRGLQITKVFPGSAADETELMPGDIITAIDDWTIPSNRSKGEIALHLQGAAGTKVKLRLTRQDRAYEFDVLRKSTEVVEARILSPGVGYLKLASFSMNAPLLMEQHLAELLKQQPATLIWDLRDNNGGSFDSALEVINLFLQEGLIVTARSSGHRDQSYRAEPARCRLPAEVMLILLVNRSSMSAAEVSAAAIMENKRGIVIGEVTYGKGTINTSYPLPGGALLELTTGKWYSPLGNHFNKTGITPAILVDDIRVKGKDNILDTALAYGQGDFTVRD